MRRCCPTNCSICGAQSNGLAYGHLEGYHLEVEEVGPGGPIVRVDAYPQQEMAIVRYQGREVLVPLREDWIQALDAARKVVRMELPDGLLDL